MTAKIIKNELRSREPDLKIEILKASGAKRMMKKSFQKRLIGAIYACPNGVIRMSDDVPGPG